MNSKEPIIKCPYCGREYLPSEIFFPESFFGKPTHITRDEKGKIISFLGESLHLTETYCCDECGKGFIAEATISFTTKPAADDIRFDSDFTTKSN